MRPMLGCGSPSSVRLFDSQVKRSRADFGEGVVAAGPAAIRRHASLAQQPALTFARPASFGETALAVEGPRADALLDRIPADDLPAFERRSPPRFTVTLRVRKLPPRAHRNCCARSDRPLVRFLPITDQPREFGELSCGVTSASGVSMSWLIFHLPSFLT